MFFYSYSKLTKYILNIIVFLSIIINFKIMSHSKLDNYMLPCINKKLFGIECPGCGMQRSISLLLEGHFKEAFEMYPAIYTLILLLTFLTFNLFIKFRFDFKIKMGLIILNAIIIFISYIIKMNHLI